MKKNKVVSFCRGCKQYKLASDLEFIVIQSIPDADYHLALFNCLACRTSVSRRMRGFRERFIVKKFDRRSARAVA